MSKMFVTCFAWCLAILMHTAVQARVLYVAVDGDDTTAQPDDPSRPYQTLKRGCENLQNGDTLEINAGVYQIVPGFPNDNYPAPDYAPMQLRNLTNITVIGKGDVEIYGEGPGDFMMIEFCSNVLVENLTFRGNRAIGGEALFSTILLRGQNDSLHFNKCRLLSFGNHGISHLFGQKKSYKLVVSDCYFADGGEGNKPVLTEDGAAISGISSNSKILNNYIERCYRGIEVEMSHGHPVTNILVQGNFLTNCYTVAIVQFATGFLPSEYQDLNIISNTIVNMANDLTAPARGGGGIGLTGGRNLNVIGNWIDGHTEGLGISINSGFLPAENIVVRGNTIKNVYLRGIQVWAVGNTLKNAIVENNTIIAAGDQGILLRGEGITCQSNVVVDVGWRAELAGIHVDGSSGVRILDNLVRNTTFAVADYGILVGPGAEECLIIGNRFEGIPQNVIRDDGVNTQILPKIASVKTRDGRMTVTLTGEPGVNHALQVSRDFESWNTASTNICPNTGVLSLMFTPTSPFRARFLRVQAMH